ncbi:MAG: hypothetical protein O3B32_04945 [Cyanobacteria bacterium]|nr:hypothetical protein [Cyanobacteriota bacterium]
MVVARLQEEWQTLRSELFPTKVVLDLSDLVLTAQRLPKANQPLDAPWIVPLPAATCRGGRPLQTEALGDFIGDLLLSYGEIKALLSVVLPAPACYWRALQWPLAASPLEPARQLRELQPDLGLPFALEQGWLDVMPVQGGDVDALVVAIERQLLADWLEVFNIAGVRLGRLVPAQVAWMVGLQERLLAADSTTLVGLLLPEPQALRLLVWRDGVPLYERLLSGELEQWLGQLEACLRFLRWQQGMQARGSIELLLAAGLAAGQQERLQLGCPQPLELLDSGGYGNLALRGLALLEGAR